MKRRACVLLGEDRDGFAGSRGLEALADLGGVELAEGLAVGEDFDGLDCGVAAGKVGDLEFVDEMNALVGASERCGRIGNAE